MEHNEAVRLNAAEKYLMGELTSAERDEYEEHYFDCAACAEELKTTVAFMQSAKQVAQEEGLRPAEVERHAGVAEPRRAGFLAWLTQPAFAVPAFAALALLGVVSYQNSVTIPELKSGAAAESQVVASSLHLMGSVRGGSEEGQSAPKLQVRAGESFLLNFDFTPSRTSDMYRWELRDEENHVVRQGTVGGDRTNREVSLPVIGGVERAGKYSLVFLGGSVNGNAKASGEEVQRLPFTVEFQQ
jgi:Putative zinc-finger